MVAQGSCQFIFTSTLSTNREIDQIVSQYMETLWKVVLEVHGNVLEFNTCDESESRFPAPALKCWKEFRSTLLTYT